MKKWIVLLLATFLTYTPVAQENDSESDPVPSQNALTKSQVKLKELIKKLDKQIEELYEKEKKDILNDRDLLKLDRLREARMIAELRMQTGYEGDDERIDELLEDELKEELPTEKPDLTKLLKKQIADDESIDEDLNFDEDINADTELARIKELLNQTKESKAVSKKNKRLLQEDEGDTEIAEEADAEKDSIQNEIFRKLKLDDSSRELYLEIMENNDKRIKELEEEEAEAYEDLNKCVESEIPNYSAVYESSQVIAKILYDKALLLLETRESLRQILSPEQFKVWSKITAKERSIKQKESSKKAESVLNEEDIIYVPMKITVDKDKNGKTIYKAVP